MQFDDDWVNDAAHSEQSARERELEAKKRLWAQQDRAELQGRGEAVRRAKQAQRAERWRKTWPWLGFFGVAAVLIAASRMFGL